MKNLKLIFQIYAICRNSEFKDSIPGKAEIVYDKDRKILLEECIAGKEAVAQFIDRIAIVIALETPI